MKKKVLCSLMTIGILASITMQEAKGEESGDINSSVITTFENERIPDGIFGTVPWYYDSGVLTFGGGEFPNTSITSGIFYGIQNKYKYNISKIIFTEPIKLKSQSSGLFYKLNSLRKIENASLLDTSEVTDMGSMFRDIGYYGGLDVDISSWDVSNVEDMSIMFELSGITKFNLNNWDVSNVKMMSRMFAWTRSKTYEIGDWDTSSVTNMTNMFQENWVAEEIDVRNWDVSNVGAMSYMFDSTMSVKSLDLSKWDTSKLRLIPEMFSQMTALEELKIGNWDTSSMTNTRAAFSGVGVKELDLSGWNLQNVTNSLNMLRSNSIEKIVLGPNIILNANMNLPEIKNDLFTGEWRLEKTPLKYNNSLDFLNSYDGTKPGIYAREGHSKLSISPNNFSLKVGKSKLLSSILNEEVIDSKSVTWSSSDPSVVKVFSNGKIQGVSVGTAVITAITNDGKLEATTDITIEL